MADILNARIKQKKATLAEWLANPLVLLDGEQAFVVSEVDDKLISFKIGNGNDPFADLPWPDFTVRAKVAASFVWTAAPSGVYIPIENGTYNGSVTVDLTAGYTILYWDGTTLIKVVYPSDLTNYLSRAEAAGTYVASSFLLVPGKNLFNPADANVALGKYLAGNGALATDSSFNTSGFIAVTGSTAYTGSPSVRFVEYYAAALPSAHTGTLVNNASGGLTFTTPSDALFVRITWRVSTYSTSMLELGSSATTYEAYSDPKVKTSLLPALQATQITDGMLVTRMFANAGVTEQKVSFLTPSTNQLNINASDVELGTFLNVSTGATAANATYNTTGFIPVTPGVQYTIGNSPRAFVYYNSSKVRVSNIAAVSPFNPITFTPPAGAVYVRISTTITGTNWTNARLNLGASLLTWERYGFYLGSSILSVLPTTLKWSSVGDSITDQEKWQPTVASKLYLTYTDQGVSGTKMGGSDTQSMWQDVRVNAIPTDADIITLLCGTNDWAQSEAIGAVTRTNVDTETFIGAANVWLSKVYARMQATKPKVRIFVMTTTVGRRIAPFPSGWGADGYINKLGLRTEDYAQALRDWAKMWSLPLVDTARTWNTFNIDTYVPSADGLHPNQDGADLMAMECITEMRDRIRFY